MKFDCKIKKFNNISMECIENIQIESWVEEIRCRKEEFCIFSKTWSLKAFLNSRILDEQLLNIKIPEALQLDIENRNYTFILILRTKHIYLIIHLHWYTLYVIFFKCIWSIIYTMYKLKILSLCCLKQNSGSLTKNDAYIIKSKLQLSLRQKY